MNRVLLFTGHRIDTRYRHPPRFPSTREQAVASAIADTILTLAPTLGNPTVVALWDGEVTDGSGGTADMVAKARQRGWPVKLIDPRRVKN